MSETEIYDAVLRRAVNEAYDRGYAAGREIGFDVGFLTAARAAYVMSRKEGADDNDPNAEPTLPSSI